MTTTCRCTLLDSLRGHRPRCPLGLPTFISLSSLWVCLWVLVPDPLARRWTILLTRPLTAHIGPKSATGLRKTTEILPLCTPCTLPLATLPTWRLPKLKALLTSPLGRVARFTKSQVAIDPFELSLFMTFNILFLPRRTDMLPNVPILLVGAKKESCLLRTPIKHLSTKCSLQIQRPSPGLKVLCSLLLNRPKSKTTKSTKTVGITSKRGPAFKLPTVLLVKEFREGSGIVMFTFRKDRKSLAKTEEGTRRAATITSAFM